MKARTTRTATFIDSRGTFSDGDTKYTNGNGGVWPSFYIDPSDFVGDDYCLTLKKSSPGNTLTLWGAGEHYEHMDYGSEGVYRFLLNKQT